MRPLEKIAMSLIQKIIRVNSIFFVLLFLFFSLNSAFAQNVFSGEPVQFVGRINGYAAVPNASPDYRTLSYRKISTTVANPNDGRGQWKTTVNVQASGGNVTPDNMPGGGSSGFLFISGSDANHYGNKWVFGGVGQAAIDGINTATYQGSTDMGINMGTSGYYTFAFQDAGYTSSAYYAGYTSSSPVALSHLGASQQIVSSGGVVSINFTTSASPSTQEKFYVRYRVGTNDFTTGTSVIQATGAGINWNATIPAQTGIVTVYYFVFSSTRTLVQLNASTESQRSLSVLNFSDNSGSNFSYTTAPIALSGNAPASGAFYASLTNASGAFSAINSGLHKGVLEITVLADVTTETGANALLASSGTSSYSSLSMRPFGARTLSGSSTTQLIDLNGADNVSIDGLNTGGNSLTIENTSSAASNGTFRFINDASGNTISNCTIKGSSNQTNAAVIFFSSADPTLLQGNDNNTISNCIIRESNSGDPAFGINSFGTPAAVPRNSNNTISNNQLLNIYSPTTALTAAIQLTNGGNSDWTITGNSIYWTTTKTSTLAAADYFYGIRITGGSGSNYNISNNFIGGMAANCGGSAMAITNNTFGNKICGIYLNIATTGTASSIQGNTIANIALNTNSNKSTASFVFSGIVIEAGLANVGTITGNTIGSTSSTGSIVISSSAVNAGGVVCGITVGGLSSNVNIANNSISGITLNNSGATNRSVSFFGIKVFSGTAAINANTIGSATIANSILNASGAAQLTDVMNTIGIQQVSGSTVASISNNLVGNMNYSASGTNANVWGVSTNSTSATISANTIRNLSNANNGTLTDATVGIYSSANETIHLNTIYGIQNTNATSNSDVMGIRTVGTGTPTVSNNLIYNLSNNNIVTNFTYGIKVLSTNANLQNNMISLGSGITNACSFRGISLEGAGSYALYFNSLVVTGASSGTNANSYSLNASSGTTIAKNNIFYNDRTPANAGSKCVFYSGSFTSDYNDFYTIAGSNIANTYTSLSAYQTAASQDLNSKNALPSFVNLANDLHINLSNCQLFGSGTSIAITNDFDNDTRKSPPDIGADEYINADNLTWTGAVSTDWHLPANWCPPYVPTATSNVTIPSAPANQPLISNANAFCQNLSINAGAAHVDMSASRVLTLSANSVFTNNGAFNSGVFNEEVVFLGTGNIAGISSTTFRNLTINGTTTLSTVPSIGASLKLNSGSSVSTAPNYGFSSTLIYNTTGSYNVNAEWTGSAVNAGTGVPNHVTIQNATTLNMPATIRGMSGDLSILSGTLQMNATSGADLNIGGNWTRSGIAGVFNPNNRAIIFKGSANQIITVTGGGAEKFNVLIIDKPLASTFLQPNNTSGNLTNIAVNGTANGVLQLLNLGSLDINGRIFYLDGNAASASAGYIFVNGPRTIYNSAGINSGSFSIMSSINTNQPTNYTKTVTNNAGVGSLVFKQDVLVTLADGRMDWGLDVNNVNITTIQGVLQINLGGSVINNSCYYSSVPPSTLRFANTIDYQVNAGDKTWVFGAIYSGIAGIPWNVEINNTNTDLTINEVRAVRNNINITDGRLTINVGPFNVGGNWTRTNPAGITTPPCAFIPNLNKVVFDKTGAGNQFILCTANAGTETFYDLDISPATVNVVLDATTNVSVVNNLLLTSGKFDLNGNRLSLGTTAASGTLTGGNASAYIMAYKTGLNGTFRRYTLATGTNYLFPLGDLSNYTPLNLTYNFGTLLSSAYTDLQLIALPHPQLGTSTSYINRYWPLTANGVSNPDYSLTYTYADADVFGLESAIFPFKYDPSGWIGCAGSGAASVQGIGSVNVSSNTLSWDNIVSFSDFTGMAMGSPLPITLLDFSGEKINKDVKLSWLTASQTNNDFFTVERSWNGSDFNAINRQKGAGNSYAPLQYFYLDEKVVDSGNSGAYYRLKQTDFNGLFTYSKTIYIPFAQASNANNFYVYPNPYADVIKLYFVAQSEGDAMLQIYGSDGKKLFQKTISVFPGLNVFACDECTNFSSGVYLAKLQFYNQIFIHKMIKRD